MRERQRGDREGETQGGGGGGGDTGGRQRRDTEGWGYLKVHQHFHDLTQASCSSCTGNHHHILGMRNK